MILTREQIETLYHHTAGHPQGTTWDVDVHPEHGKRDDEERFGQAIVVSVGDDLGVSTTRALAPPVALSIFGIRRPVDEC